MKLSPTTVATVILESDTPTAELHILAELMGLNSTRLSDSYMAQTIYIALSKELARLQRKVDKLNNALAIATDRDSTAYTVVDTELQTARAAKHHITDQLEQWVERFPRCIPVPRLTLAQALKELDN